MKRPLFVTKEDWALPSSYEKHSGETRDPTGHAAEIDEAKRTLLGFVEDMNAKRIPSETPDLLGTAADVVCAPAKTPLFAVMLGEAGNPER